MPPPGAGDRQPQRDRRIDVGELKGFKLSLGPARLGEHTEPLSELLFEIETHARAVVRRANGGDVCGHTGLAGDGRRLAVPSHPTMREKAQQLELPRLSKDGVPCLDLQVNL